MTRRFLATLSALAVILLLSFTVLLNPRNHPTSSSKELIVMSQTKGNETLTAVVLDNQVSIKLKNNHKETITAFAIRLNEVTIKEDFAYSEVHFGIEPGDTFEKDYPISPSTQISEIPKLYLLTVLLRSGAKDGNSKVAQEIKDERLGEKIQILRVLRILEKEGTAPKDINRTKIVAALDVGESETRVTLSEIEPTPRLDEKLSDDMKEGLQVGREKMLRRFEVVEHLPAEFREKGLIEFKERANKLFAKL